MNENFKILIAYDGSECADAALEDLRLAGFSENGVEAMTVSVAEVWLPPTNAETDDVSNFLTESLRKKQEKNLQIFEDTKRMAERAAERVSSMFPRWNVRPEATYGSPAWEVLARADAFRPDLIVVGSQGLSMLERIWLGSVSQKILTEAKCSVRVARARSAEKGASPIRLAVAFDGTAGAEKAVDAVAGRHWPAKTEVRLIIVEDIEVVIEAFSFEQNTSELEKRGREIIDRFEEKGLKASLRVVEGNPKDLIVMEAQDFGADSIFAGATKFSGAVERFLLGSVSSAVTARAHCSVEVVRS
ncbi:MAG: universal stress protein [Pyrinomonadaceae bacterium]